MVQPKGGTVYVLIQKDLKIFWMKNGDAEQLGFISEKYEIGPDFF